MTDRSTISPSRKMTMAIAGLSCVVVIWLGSLVCGIMFESAFGHIVTLAQVAIGLVGSIITVFIAGQSIVDFKNPPQNPPVAGN